MACKNNSLQERKERKNKGRPKKYQGHSDEETKVYSKRIPISKYFEVKNSVDKIIEDLVKGNFLESNVEINNDIDTQILKKLIVPFARRGLKVDLEENEIKRITELFEELNE